MTVHKPGFSERVFEFGFNAEFAQRTVLVAAPHIPTQNQEKVLGYDVKFTIKNRGKPVRMIALQHKVARQVCGGTGPSKYETLVGPNYFAFRLDVDQFNLIQRVISSAPPELDFFYCAPTFTSMLSMNGHYLSNDVEKNSVWFDVRGVGPLTKTEPHSIVYSESVANAYVFSEEPKILKIVWPLSIGDADKRDEREFNPSQIYDAMFKVVSEHWSAKTDRKMLRGGQAENMALATPPMLPPGRREISGPLDAIQAIAEIASEYLGCSVFVETEDLIVVKPPVESTKGDGGN